MMPPKLLDRFRLVELNLKSGNQKHSTYFCTCILFFWLFKYLSHNFYFLHLGGLKTPSDKQWICRAICNEKLWCVFLHVSTLCGVCVLSLRLKKFNRVGIMITISTMDYEILHISRGLASKSYRIGIYTLKPYYKHIIKNVYLPRFVRWYMI